MSLNAEPEPDAERRASDSTFSIDTAPGQAPASGRAADSDPPLIGRDAEMARLRRAWERAVAGCGGVVLLSGAAGIGKTRLGREFLETLVLDQGIALQGQGYAAEERFPYHPLIAPLRHAIELTRRALPSSRRRYNLAALGDLLPELNATAPTPATQSFRDGPRTAWLLVDAVTQFLLDLARERPVCLFLDDLHWADPATGSCWDYLGHRARQGSLLLIGSYRDEALADTPWLQRWVTLTLSQRLATSVVLSPLGRRHADELFDYLAGDQIDAPSVARLRDQVFERTEGNPLYLVETMRAIREDPHSTLGSVEAERPTIGIPPTLQRTLDQRLGRLAEEDRELVDHVAIVGRGVTFTALQQIVVWPRERLLMALERLLESGLLQLRSGPGQFDFSHEMLRATVYEAVPIERRRMLHLQTALALEALYGAGKDEFPTPGPLPEWYLLQRPEPRWSREAEHAEELAHHFRAARPLAAPEKAIRYAYLTGRRARGLAAFEKAVTDLASCLEIVDSLPEERRRREWMSRLVEELVPAYRGAGRVDEALGLLRAYLDRSEADGDSQGVVRGAMMLGLFLDNNLVPNETETNRSMCERAIAVCEAAGLDEWILYPKCQLALSLVELDIDPPRAATLVESCAVRVAQSQDPTLLRLFHTTSLWLAVRRGELESALTIFNESLSWGGPLTLSIKSLLATAEERFHEAGMDAAFYDLCRQLAEAYRRAAMEPPLEQWFLAPATPNPAPGLLMVDVAFDRSTELPVSLAWQGDFERSAIDRASRPGWLGIAPPLQCDLWPEADLNAPRLTVSVDGDFAIETEIDLQDGAGLLAGLLLWRDERHFVRHELRISPDGSPGVYIEACLAGRFRLIGRGRYDGKTIRLRLERNGRTVRGLCSPDGANWLTCGSLSFPYPGGARVGIAAITQAPDQYAWFRDFRLWTDEEATREGDPARSAERMIN